MRGSPGWLAVLAVSLLLAASSARAHWLPADSGAIDVRAYGAKGDGRTDDTAAIRAAIRAARVDQRDGFWPSKIVYFPRGTYLISGTLDSRDRAGRYASSMVLMGEDASAVSLRLLEGAPGFGDPKRPRAMVYMTSGLLRGDPRAGGKDYEGLGEGNDAYANYVEDLTIDVGQGNPGAIAVDYLANNSGAIRGVHFRASAGSGLVAIAMDRKWPGPLLISQVTIQGYAVGVSVSQREYGVTLDRVALNGQTEVAIRNRENMLTMRDVSIETAAIGVQNLHRDGLIVADRLTVRHARRRALWMQNRGYLVQRGVSVVGPTGGADKGAPIESGSYFGSKLLGEFSADWRGTSMLAPAVAQDPPSAWTNVVAHGAKPDSGEDATPAIRAALRSGAATVYFPSGRYVIRGALDIPAHVRRIAGMHSSLALAPPRERDFSRSEGALNVASGGEPLAIERIAIDNMGAGDQVGVQHSGARQLLLRDTIAAGARLRRTESGGPLFLENVCCGPLDVAGKNVVSATQLDTEGKGVRIVNDGAPLVVLGVKSEQNCTLVANRAGAQSEIIGGLLYLVHREGDALPAFVNDATSRLYAAYVESAYRSSAVYSHHFLFTTRAGLRERLSSQRLPARGLGRVVPGVTLTPSRAGERAR
jgi:hypothetical protein